MRFGDSVVPGVMLPYPEVELGELFDLRQCGEVWGSPGTRGVAGTRLDRVAISTHATSSSSSWPTATTTNTLTLKILKMKSTLIPYSGINDLENPLSTRTIEDYIIYTSNLSSARTSRSGLG